MTVPGVHTIGAGAGPAKPFWTQKSEIKRSKPRRGWTGQSHHRYRFPNDSRAPRGTAEPVRSGNGSPHAL